jgi:hypothetical protein
MADFFDRIGFSTSFSMELNISKETFVSTLSKNVPPDELTLRDVFHPWEKKVEGELGKNDTFVVKTTLPLMSQHYGRGIGRGNFFEKDQKLIVDVAVSTTQAGATFFILCIFGCVPLFIAFVAIVAFIQDGRPFGSQEILIILGFAAAPAYIFFGMKKVVQETEDKIYLELKQMMNPVSQPKSPV